MDSNGVSLVQSMQLERLEQNLMNIPAAKSGMAHGTSSGCHNDALTPANFTFM
jgi:hypothetical protein